MFTTPKAVVDPSEHEAFQVIVSILNAGLRLDSDFSTVAEPEAGSALYMDHDCLPELSLRDYAETKLTIAFGSMEAFGRWIGLEQGENSSVETLPFGGYSLLRTAMECAGEALWVLKPDSRKKRLERRLMAQADEVANAKKFLVSIDSKNLDQVDTKKANLEKFAQRTSPGWSPFKRFDDDKLESKIAPISNILSEVDGYRNATATQASWAAMWRACSGASHGQAWALMFLNERKDVDGSRVDFTQTVNLLANFHALLTAAFSTHTLVKAACLRYAELARVKS